MSTRSLILPAVLLVIPAGALALMCTGDANTPKRTTQTEQKQQQSAQSRRAAAPAEEPRETPPPGVISLAELSAVDTLVGRRGSGVLKKLQTRMTRNFKQVELSEFLGALAKEGRFALSIDRQGLEDEGIRLDTKVSVKIKDRTILNQIRRL